MGTEIPWESHRNCNKTQNWEWEWETTSVGMGITCIPMGIYSQRFYAAMSLLSYQYYTCQMPMPIVPSEV